LFARNSAREGRRETTGMKISDYRSRFSNFYLPHLYLSCINTIQLGIEA